MNKITRKFFCILSVAFVFFIGLGLLSVLFLGTFFCDLPDCEELINYVPPGITRLYDPNGQVLDEYAKEKRIYVKYQNIPKIITNSFIAVEDKNFFNHKGVDIDGILRASIQNILNIGTHKRLVGGSTITQQVVKGFFLTNERSFVRKLKEAVLAYRVNKVFSKEKVLEIYLNQIYLGNHSYGIYVAAYNYFGKNLDQINTEEAALLASLPKAPSILNPYKNYKKALIRRNWAIQRIQEEGYITLKESSQIVHSKIQLRKLPIHNKNYENYYTDTVKSELISLFDEYNVYSKGFIVNININVKLQKAAQQALKNGLRKHDKNQGWRGKFAKVNLEKNFVNELQLISKTKYHNNYLLGVIIKINNDSLTVTLQNNHNIILLNSSFEWILNKKINVAKQLKQKFHLGDVVLIDQDKNGHYKLEQIPAINGAIVVIENISGKILALVGGYDYYQSKFNRVTQARRQPGSAFKTFVYLVAFEENITPNTSVLDEPLEIDLGHGLPIYKPKNYADKYYGLITLRTSFEKSRNLSTLRLLLGIGLDKLSEVAKRYFIYSSDVHPSYSMALGSYETTLLKMTNAYASIANNGLLKQPKLIDSIYNRNGELIYAPKDIYTNTQGAYGQNKKYQNNPNIGYLGKQLTDDGANYQVLSLLEGVVQRGSARRAKILKRTIAGKTGTTNNSLDTWFIGMTPDITVGVFVGHDIPKDIGRYATGSNIPLPIFIDFLKHSNFIPNREFQIPNIIKQNYVDLNTGSIIETIDRIGGNKYILENFKRSH